MFLHTPSDTNVSQSEVYVTEFNRNKLKNIPLLEFQPVSLASVHVICAPVLQKNIPVTLCCIVPQTLHCPLYTPC